MKLRKFNKTKRLNEADDNAQQQQNNNQPTDQNQQNNNNNQSQQSVQNNNNNNNQPAEQTHQTNNNNQPQQLVQNNNNNQQDSNQQQQQQQQQVDPEKQKHAEEVNTFLKTVRDNVQQNKIYWALANDFVGEVQKNIPEFKADNPAAKPGIDAWETFKKDPSQQNFDAFIDQLQTFAGVSQQQQPTAEQAQQQKAVNDSLVIDFGARLEKRLHEQLMIDKLSRQIEQGIYEAKHNI